jgi:hypothetical protein
LGLVRRLALIGVLAFAFALPATARAAGSLLMPDSPVVGIDHGKPVDGFRTDNVVRFDPVAPQAQLAQEAQTEDDGGSVYDYALPVGGDVSGDGLEDVLHVHVQFSHDGSPGQSVIEARRGSDGASLWHVEFGDNVYWGGYLPGDTTGDGKPDLAFVTLENVQIVVITPLPGLACFDCLKYVLTGTTRLRVLDGSTGAWRWEDDHPVTYTFIEQPVLPVLLRAWVSSNLLSAFSAAGDEDGDGGRELLWEPWQGTYTDLKSTQTTFATAYQGASGTPLWSLRLTGGGTSPWNHDLASLAGAWPGPDGNADGVPDVYTSEIQETPTLTTLTRKGIDGRTGEPFWSRDRQWPTDDRVLDGAYLPLRGGGLVYRLTGTDFRSDVEAIDPMSGSERWRQLGAPALSVLPAGDINRDGREDVFYFGYNPTDVSVSLTGVDGKSGAALSQQRIPLQGWQWFYLMSPFLDQSGDGVVDLVHGQGRETSTGVDEAWSVTSLSNGSDLWGFQRSAVSGVTYLVPAGNLDGKRANDVLLVRIYGDSSEPDPRIDLAALRGESGRVIWQRTPYRQGEPGKTIWQASVGFMRDANGRRGDEVLFSSINLWDYFFANELSMQADLIDGKRGVTYLRMLGS